MTEAQGSLKTRVSLDIERESRAMFMARLENMQARGDRWLTTEAVLALLNDCDMLAQKGMKTQQPPS